jgi:hypothetical protein
MESTFDKLNEHSRRKRILLDTFSHATPGVGHPIIIEAVETDANMGPFGANRREILIHG